jgi:hypothetical protein
MYHRERVRPDADIYQKSPQVPPHCTTLRVGIKEPCFDEFYLEDSWPFSGALLNTAILVNRWRCSPRGNVPPQQTKRDNKLSHCFKIKPPTEDRPVAIKLVS